jgi:hypothetical protein
MTHILCISFTASLSKRNFNTRMLIDKMSVTPFANATGLECDSNPYVSHIAVPAEKIENIPSDISLAVRSFTTRINCGKNEIVVHVAAA